MKPKNINEIQKSFTAQAQKYENYNRVNPNMNITTQENFDWYFKSLNLKSTDCVLETAAGTCVCGRSIAPFVKSVVCLDATPAMLNVGKEEAIKSGITNIQFINGYVEDMSFEAQCFDIVLTRSTFHHFTEIEKPFIEMNRVLKCGGQLAIIDMEAAEESLREIEDKIETMRDPSHVRNRSQAELLDLYDRYGYTITKQEATIKPVALSAWLDLTNTPDSVRKEIEDMMNDEIHNGDPTGFRPFVQNGEIYFEQRWMSFIGVKSE